MVLLIRSGGGVAARARTPAWGLRPRSRGNGAAELRIAACCATLAALFLFAIPARADEIEPEPEIEPAPTAAPTAEPEPEPEPEPTPEPVAQAEAAGPFEPSWIPSVEVGFETFDYNTRTTVQNFVNPPSFAGTQKEAERQLMLRVGGELMGPMFEDLPGRPRMFVQGGAQFQLFSSDLIYREDDPFVAGEPEREIANYYAVGDLGKDLPAVFEGQGTEISARFENPSWYAGVGLAFSVPITTNLLLYLKPSVQYSVEEIDLPAGLTTVDEPIPRVDPDECGTAKNPPHPDCNREFFVIRSRATKSTTDHSIGAGLEVALVPFKKTRPIRVTIYAQARFLWLISDDTTEYSDPNGFATYSVTRDDFGIKGGGGLRFSWVGFD